MSAESLFPHADLQRLRELLPRLQVDAHVYRDAGEVWFRLKKIIPHGKFGRAVQVAGYEGRTVQLCIFIFKSGKTGEELNGPINKVLAAIRQGKKRVYKDHINLQADRLRGEYGPEQDAIVEGDSLDWLRAQDDDSIPYFITDAPYGIGMKYDGWTEPDTAEGHYAFIRPFWEGMCRTLAPGGTIVMWQDRRYMHLFNDWFPGCVVDVLPVLVRGKRVWNPLVRWQKDAKVGAIHRSLVTPNVPTWIDPVYGSHEMKYNECHPCPKSLRDVEAVVKHYTVEGALVADPFCGTGTIPAVCQQLGRKFVGVERNPEYARLARTRLLGFQTST